MDGAENKLESIADVRSFVASLPAPKPGRVRVFRGQNRDYGSLVPSSFRNPEEARSRAIWRVYSHYLAQNGGSVQNLPVGVFWGGEDGGHDFYSTNDRVRVRLFVVGGYNPNTVAYKCSRQNSM